MLIKETERNDYWNDETKIFICQIYVTYYFCMHSIILSIRIEHRKFQNYQLKNMFLYLT